MAIDGTSPDLEIHPHVLGYRRRCGQRRDELGAGIDDAPVLFDIRPVAQGLDSARRRARADRDQIAALLADPYYPARIVGSGDAAFDEGDVVRSRHGAASRLRKEG